MSCVKEIKNIMKSDKMVMLFNGGSVINWTTTPIYKKNPHIFYIFVFLVQKLRNLSESVDLGYWWSRIAACEAGFSKNRP